MKLLAIDCGNSRCKWGLFDETGVLLESVALNNGDLASSALPSAQRVIIAMVGSKPYRQHLQQRYPHAEWFSSQLVANSLINRYQAPQSLGCDRWAAVIAAWHTTHRATLVVDAGTATTIDAIISEDDRGVFLGGHIVAGLDLLISSLAEHTAGLGAVQGQRFDGQENVADFARNTLDAVKQGALQATLGAIRQAFGHLSSLSYTAPKLLLCGGNASILAAHLPTATIAEHLVLQGLYLSARL